MTSEKRPRTKVGVIGVGSMGQHHARLYNELPGATLVGVSDVDGQRASKIANQYETTVMERESLLDHVDAVSVAVPTQYHRQVASECITHGVDTLIEKPFVSELEEGVALIDRANDNDVTIQVGHVERFNPAVIALDDILTDLDIISIRTQRLGPSPERAIQDSAVLDLMIHDLDIVLALLEEAPTRVNAVGVQKNDHATATIQFPTDTIATLTASRVTQQKTRTLEITAPDCFISVDYLNRSIEIHRLSVPEYIEQHGDVRYRHEGIIEKPMVSSEEPLKKELESFVEAVATGGTPRVTAEEGLRAVRIANQIDALAGENEAEEKSMEVTR